MPKWTFANLPTYMDPKMPRDRVMFVNENGMYEMTGLAPAAEPPSDVSMEAELEKARERAQQAAMDSLNAAQNNAGDPSRNSLYELNRISEQLAMQATANILNPNATWLPGQVSNIFNNVATSGDLSGGGFIQAPYAGSMRLFPPRQDSVDDLFGNASPAAGKDKGKPASAEPEALSKNGGRFVMLEDPE